MLYESKYSQALCQYLLPPAGCTVRGVYELCKAHGLTTNELFVLDILWFTPAGCLQSDICQRMSATKQTFSAIVKKFLKQGYVSLTESQTDRRHKIITLTPKGQVYTERIIVPAANAELDAMAVLSEQDVAELIRLTTLFSQKMKETFSQALQQET